MPSYRNLVHGSRAKLLATKLRNRCARELVHPEHVRMDRAALDKIRVGEHFMFVGTPFEDIGEWIFEVAEERKMAYGGTATVWSCKIHVSPNRDVFVEDTTNKAPRHVLACALGGL